MSLVIILAHGKSIRFGTDKLQKNINGIPLLEKTVSVFQNHSDISEIILVSSPENKKYYFEKFSKLSEIITGGNSRYESFSLGIEHCIKKNITGSKKIIIHNGANPFVTPKEISKVLSQISKNIAVGVGRKINNTIRKVENKRSKIINRTNVYAMETPQGALLSSFFQWIELEKKNAKKEITDELMLAENNGGRIQIILASAQNIKITTEHDIPKSHDMYPITGLGIDSHQLEKNISECPCVLCGIEIKNTPKFLANSDGDVAFHSLCNAILSGLGKNSFSYLADRLYKNGEKNSEKYLLKVLEILNNSNKKIIHISLSFEGSEPKIEKYFPLFRTNISLLLNIQNHQIGLNATTGEKIDGYGKGKAMKVTALVTMV